MSTATRQHPFSLKAFKGKGEVCRLLVAARERLTGVWADMESLSEASRQIQGHFFYLFLHKFNHAGAERGITLRWRMRGGKHATWDEVLQYLSQTPVHIQEWYHDANQIGMYLNTIDKNIRAEIRNLEQLLKDLEQSERVNVECAEM